MSDGEAPKDLTEVVGLARSGLRSAVQRLVDVLDEGELLLPLSDSVPGVELGERRELDGELPLSPHLLGTEEGAWASLFTRTDVLEAAGEELDWTTGGGPLEYCSLPARAALDAMLDVVDEQNVMGLVLNALHDTELVLRRHEIASLAQSQAIPLVGYVSQIPEQPGERSLVAQADGPPPPEVVESVERVLSNRPGVASWSLHRTFNAERDLEPHLTVHIRTAGEIDRDKIARLLGEALEGRLAPPGYLDVVFDDPGLS